MVKEDKSLKTFIEKGENWLEPLREYRDWLLSIRENPEYREKSCFTISNASAENNGTLYSSHGSLFPFILKYKSTSVLLVKSPSFSFGSYAGVCEFDLQANKKGNIVLIGGKNGAGKTTLFSGIKLCLYGNKAAGFENINASSHNYHLLDHSKKAYPI